MNFGGIADQLEFLQLGFLEDYSIFRIFASSCLYILLTGSSCFAISMSSEVKDSILFKETIYERWILVKESLGSISSSEEMDCLVIIVLLVVTTFI